MTLKLPFSFTISGTLSFEKNEGQEIEVEMECTISGDTTTKTYPMRKIFGLPPNTFIDDDQFIKWAAEIAATFREFAASTLAHDTTQHLRDMAYYVTVEQGIADGDYSEVIRERLAELDRFMRHRFSVGLQRGQRSDWTKPELSMAIRVALSKLPRSTSKTLDHIAKKLKEDYPGKAPKNGESLRKLIDRLGIDWKPIKSGEV